MSLPVESCVVAVTWFAPTTDDGVRTLLIVITCCVDCAIVASAVVRVSVRDAARLSVEALDEAYRNQHVIVTGPYPIQLRQLLAQRLELLRALLACFLRRLECLLELEVRPLERADSERLYLKRVLLEHQNEDKTETVANIVEKVKEEHPRLAQLLEIHGEPLMKKKWCCRGHW